MGGAEFPPCWFFGLGWPSTGAYRLFGGANDRLREGSCQGVFPRTSAASVLVPTVIHSQPHLCRRPSNTSRLVWFSLLLGPSSFPRVLMLTLVCVCPPIVESLFLPVLSKSCNLILWKFSSCCWTPRLGNLMWGSEPSRQWVDFCGIIVLLFVNHPPSSFGIWFYCDCTLLLSHCSFFFVFGCGVSSLVSSSVFLWMIIQQLVVIPVFSQ